VFTSGATEANRLGVLGRSGPPGVIAWSARDHAGVATAAEELVRRGWRPRRLEVDRLGSVADAADALAAGLPADTTAVICLTTACGQTGTVDPPCPAVARHPQIDLHIDHTQAFAWDDPPIRDVRAATLTIAPHKFGGPRGIAGLVVRGVMALEPLQPGPQELGIRGGTESVALAVGFARAVEATVAERAAAVATVTRLRNRLEVGLLAAASAAGLEGLIVGGEAPRAPHVTTIAIAGIDRQSLVMAADLEGVCLATGTACASGSSEPAAAVEALGLPAWVARSAFRASLATTTTDDDVDEAVRRMAFVFRGIAGGGLQRSAGPR
jgi:cysteine desulfurase